MTRPTMGPRTSRSVRPLQSVSVHSKRLSQTVLALGWRQGIATYALDLLPGTRRHVSRWRGIRTQVVLRLGRQHSDLRTGIQVLHDAEYDVELPGTVTTIVDAGANIGLASVWFAHRHPGARIVALEPDAESAAVLRENVRDLPQVEVLEVGLWREDTVLALVDPGGGAWSMQLREPGDGAGGAIEAVSMDTLLGRVGMDRVGLLKVDIEGAEYELFEDASSWIDRVDAIAVELHDRFRPGCARRFFDATREFTTTIQHGENTFAIRAAD